MYEAKPGGDDVRLLLQNSGAHALRERFSLSSREVKRSGG
jgi:hypothetical protein